MAYETPLELKLVKLFEKYGAEEVGKTFRQLANSPRMQMEFKLTDEEAEALSRYAEAYDMGPIDIHDLQIELEFPWETKRRAEEFVEQLKGDEVQPPYPG